jgi:hypothetical protein
MKNAHAHSAVEKLKRSVIQSKDFFETLNYFFDLMDAEVFSNIKSHRRIGEIRQYPELLPIIQLVQHQVSKRFDKVINQMIPLFFEIPEHHFFHGSCLFEEFHILLTVIYFSDIRTGILAMAAIGDEETDMMRFSFAEVSSTQKMH